MTNFISKYCDIVRSSSMENEKAIRMLYENKLYKKVIGTLREELDLYARTLYLLNQSSVVREILLSDFFQNQQWRNSKGQRLTDREMLDYTSNITGYGWEKISYRFACCFIHLSVLHNWANEDVTAIIEKNEKQVIIDYINNYHGANLDAQSSFDDIMQYSLDIFKKIKENMDYYLTKLERNDEGR